MKNLINYISRKRGGTNLIVLYKNRKEVGYLINLTSLEGAI